MSTDGIDDDWNLYQQKPKRAKKYRDKIVDSQEEIPASGTTIAGLEESAPWRRGRLRVRAKLQRESERSNGIRPSVRAAWLFGKAPLSNYNLPPVLNPTVLETDVLSQALSTGELFFAYWTMFTIRRPTRFFAKGSKSICMASKFRYKYGTYAGFMRQTHAWIKQLDVSFVMDTFGKMGYQEESRHPEKKITAARKRSLRRARLTTLPPLASNNSCQSGVS